MVFNFLHQHFTAYIFCKDWTLSYICSASFVRGEVMNDNSPIIQLPLKSHILLSHNVLFTTCHFSLISLMWNPRSSDDRFWIWPTNYKWHSLNWRLSFLGCYIMPLCKYLPMFQRNIMPSKYQYLLTRWRIATSQKTCIFSNTTVETQTSQSLIHFGTVIIKYSPQLWQDTKRITAMI